MLGRIQKFFSTLGYREKLIAAFSLLTILALAALYLIASPRHKSDVYKEVKYEARMLCKLISSDAHVNFNIVNEIPEIDDRVQYALVFDSQKQIVKSIIVDSTVYQIAHSNRPLKPFIARQARTWIIGNNLLDAVLPLVSDGKVDGYIRLGIDLSGANDRIDVQKDLYLLIFIFALGIGIAFTFVLGKNLDAPIRQMARYARTIAMGGHAPKLEISNKDELGNLAESLNAMVDQLQESQFEIRTYQRSLEKRIADQSKSLVESEVKYRNLVEASKDIIFIIQDSRLVYCNSRFNEIFDSEGNRYLEEHLDNLNFITDNDRRRLINLLAKISANDDKVYSVEINGLREDGKEIILEVSLHRLRYENRPAFQGSMRDITERKKFEKDLFQIQKMESIGILAGGIAHDFKNILGVVIPNAEMIRNMSEPGTTIYREATQIDAAAQRASELVSRLMAFSRKEKLKMETVDPNQIIENIIKLLERVIGKSITIKSTFHSEIEPILVNVNQLELVILNIAVNARDAMPNGGTLSVETKNISYSTISNKIDGLTRGRRYVQISIRDTGSGMPKEVMQQIFDPFFTTKDEGKGTGLGLSTVKGIIESHQGLITVESQPNQGTTFHLFFPAASGEVATSEPDEQTNIEKGIGKIMVVEDDAMMLETVNNLLDHLGYETLSALNGQQALELYKTSAKSIDVILIDMEMPLMNGLELLREIFALNPHARIVISSGYNNMDDNIKVALSEGAKAFLRKPYRLAELSKVLKNILQGASNLQKSE